MNQHVFKVRWLFEDGDGQFFENIFRVGEVYWEVYWEVYLSFNIVFGVSRDHCGKRATPSDTP